MKLSETELVMIKRAILERAFDLEKTDSCKSKQYKQLFVRILDEQGKILRENRNLKELKDL